MPHHLMIQTRDGSFNTCPEYFFALTNSRWIETMQMQPDPEASLDHIQPSLTDWELMRFLRPFYNIYLKRPPKLYIKENTTQGCHSLHAFEPIPKGSIATEYLGEWAPESTIHSSYRWGPIDGLHHRNFGGMAEDSFPNMGAFYLYQTKDLPLRVVFIALEDIGAGEMLTVNYGMNHSVKVNYHDEYALDRLLNFFSTHPLKKCIERIEQLHTKKRTELGWAKTLELENLTAKIQYIYQTPSTLSLLIKEKIISYEEVFAIYDEAKYRFYILGFPFQPNLRQAEVIKAIEQLKSL